MLTLCATLGYAAYVYIPPILRGTGCEARTKLGELSLTTEQAQNAATVAAVGIRMDLPRRATTIALAAAFQESKLRNVAYGDRDSLGLFQQRPSQGWGKPRQILDPVYAATQFYAALRDVQGYRTMPVHQAAQAVQRSADGTAYARHTTEAKILSAALTGRAGAALRCWFDEDSEEFDFQGLRTQLVREFGQGVELQASDGGMNIVVPGQRRGWALALWAVAKAEENGIASVAYSGSRWTAGNGYEGWQPADTPARRVLIRGQT